MLKNVSSTFFIMLIAMLSSFAVTIYFGRILSVSDFGEFALLKQILMTGSTIAIFGLDYSYIKSFAKNPESGKNIHLLSLAVLGGISIIFVIGIAALYGYAIQKLSYILLSVFIGAMNLYVAAIYRLKRKFLIAQLLSGGWKIILMILVLGNFATNQSINMQFIYQLISISFVVFSPFFINVFYRAENKSSIHLDLRHYLTMGMIFWMINSAGLISGGVDKLVIPLLFGGEILGIYTAISFIFTISLSMVGSAVGYVLFPKISVGEKVNLKKMSLILVAITFSATILFQIIGVDMVRILFSEKYDNYLNPTLIFTFTIIGSLQVVHTILHFIISAKGNRRQLLGYWGLTLFFIVLFISLLFAGRYFSSSIFLYLSIITIITQSIKILTMMLILRKMNNNISDGLKPKLV